MHGDGEGGGSIGGVRDVDAGDLRARPYALKRSSAFNCKTHGTANAGDIISIMSTRCEGEGSG